MWCDVYVGTFKLKHPQVCASPLAPLLVLPAPRAHAAHPLDPLCRLDLGLRHPDVRQVVRRALWRRLLALCVLAFSCAEGEASDQLTFAPSLSCAQSALSSRVRPSSPSRPPSTPSRCTQCAPPAGSPSRPPSSSFQRRCARSASSPGSAGAPSCRSSPPSSPRSSQSPSPTGRRSPRPRPSRSTSACAPSPTRRSPTP